MDEHFLCFCPQVVVLVVFLEFRFVDDINVILDADAELIHIRSASRVGHSDFGVNRKRIEALRTELRKLGVID